jgi:GTP-dependent phosphoenolpyruvate carboxykinase
MRLNWVRRGDDRWYLKPRSGQGSRVLKWVIRHIDGNAAATTKATGLVQAPGALDLTELTIAEADALDVDSEEWTAELRLIQESDLADLETRLQG